MFNIDILKYIYTLVTWKMAQLVKCLLIMHEVLGSDPQHCLNIKCGSTPIIPALGIRSREEDSWSLSASQSSQLASSRFTERHRLKDN